jgi:hypothetical protein
MNNGLLSAKEIIEKNRWNVIISENHCLVQFQTKPNDGNKLDKKYLDFDLFLWRCLQYKKYVFNNRYLNDILLEFKRDYPEAYSDYVKSNKSFHYWLFDFVMNGNMDGEKK